MHKTSCHTDDINACKLGSTTRRKVSLYAVVLVIASMTVSIAVIAVMYVSDDRRGYDVSSIYEFQSNDVNLPLMISEENDRLLRVLSSYLQRAIPLISYNAEKGLSGEQLFSDIEPCLFGETSYTVQLAQEKTLEIIGSIEIFPKFLQNEFYLFESVIGYVRMSYDEGDNFSKSNCDQLQIVRTCIINNAQIFLACSRYEMLISVLEKIAFFTEMEKIYGSVSLRNKRIWIITALDFLEEVATANHTAEKWSHEEIDNFVEHLRRIKHDIQFSLISYLEFQRFNFSSMLLGRRLPYTHQLDMDDALSALSILDKYINDVRNQCRETVSKDDIDSAFRHWKDITGALAADSSQEIYTVPEYILQTKAEIRAMYYSYTYNEHRLDQIIKQMSSTPFISKSGI